MTERDDWLVDEMSEESLPDSDPPSTWAGRDRRPSAENEPEEPEADES